MLCTPILTFKLWSWSEWWNQNRLELPSYLFPVYFIFFLSTKKVSKFLALFLSHSEIPRQLLQTQKGKCKNIQFNIGLIWPHKNGFLEIKRNTNIKRCFTLMSLIKLLRKERKGTSNITYVTIRNWCNNKILHILTGRKIQFRFWHYVKLHKYV